MEKDEQHNETALREVKEETGVSAQIIKYVGKSNYTFNTSYDTIKFDGDSILLYNDKIFTY